ncbi:MAG: DUF3299 domain-containing protein, partial [Deltaproteobacteria bacterium]|nr:DUF3299 domain-containing protein [Deltaproteobacteria bacterium]
MKLLLLLTLLLLPADRTAVAAEADASGRALGDRLENPRNALADNGYKEIGWEELIPPSWNPAEAFAGMNLDEMEDD